MNRRPAYSGINTFHAPVPPREEPPPPPKNYGASLDRLNKAGFHYKHVRVRVLSPHEGRLVRRALNDKRSKEFEDCVKRQLRQNINVDFAHLTGPERQQIYAMRIQAMKKMEWHHIFPVSLCPIDLAPSKKWKDILPWWQSEAHKHLTVISTQLHDDIHDVIERNLDLAFRKRVFNTQNRQSNPTNVVIAIPMLQEDCIWSPVGPSNQELLDRFGSAVDTATRPAKRTILTLASPSSRVATGKPKPPGA